MTISEQDLGRISGLIQTGGGVYSGGGKTYTPVFSQPDKTKPGITTYEVKDVASGVNVGTPSNSPNYNPNVAENAIAGDILPRLSPEQSSAMAGNIKPDESSIRAGEEAAQQARLNSIAEYYRPILDEERRAGVQRTARANAALAAAGLMGSEGIVNTKRGEQEAITKENLQAIEARKALDISRVYDTIDANVQKKYDAQLLENTAEAEAEIKKIANQAKDALSTLAVSSKGGSFDDFVALSKTSPEWGDFMKNLKEQSGLTDYQLRELWDNSIPAEYKPITERKYYADAEGNTILADFKYSPKTGKTSVSEHSIGIPYASFRAEDLLKGANGELYMLQKQEDGSMKAIEVTPGKAVELGKGATLVDPKTGKVIARGQQDAVAGTGVGAGEQYGSDLDAIIGATLATIPSKFGQTAFREQISKARNDGDKISLVAATVLKGSPAEVKNDFRNQAVGVGEIDKALKILDNGTKTGLINNTKQYLFNVFGKDYDPQLAAIQGHLTAAIQPYRNSITGAAWGDQEDAEYNSLFGSTKYSPKELRERLERVKELLKTRSAIGLNAFVNPLDTYQNPFSPSGEGESGTGEIKLQDPESGEVRAFSDLSPEEVNEAIQKGFIQIQ